MRRVKKIHLVKKIMKITFLGHINELCQIS